MKTFKQTIELDPNTIMIVDALNLAFRWKHSGATKFLEDYMHTVESLRKSYKAEKVIIACDSGSSSYRKEIFPDYKQNRKELYEAQSESERLAFGRFFKEFNLVIDEYKNSSKYPTLKFKNVEADDIAAYVVNKYRKTNNIWLISSDKDWDLLINANVSRFSYVTRKEITEENWNEHYAYNMDKHLSIKCLTGDPGDNIPGVDGIGPKRAISLVEEFGDTYDIISSIPISSKYKFIQSLNTFGKENLLRNYALMDLISYCDEAIGKENCNEIDMILKEYIK